MQSLIIEDVELGVYSKDKNGVYLYCNEVFAEEADVDSPSQIIGKTDKQLVWGEQSKYINTVDHKVMTGSKYVNEPFHVLRDSEEVLLVYTTKSPLLDARGDVIGISGVSVCDKTPSSAVAYDVADECFKFSASSHTVNLTRDQVITCTMLMCRHNYDAIAKRLNVARRTVEERIKKLCREFQVANPGELITVMLKTGLIYLILEIGQTIL